MLRPIEARVPLAASTELVVSPPYDALRPAERYQFALAHPDNFLSVILSPGDYPEPLDPAELGALARRHLGRIAEAHYADRADPAYYIYEMEAHAHRQRGIVGAISAGQIGALLGHERVIPRRVAALNEFFESTGINTSPIAVTFRDHAPAVDFLAQAVDGPPDLEYRSPEGVAHRLWRTHDTSAADAFASIERWYITDGHHRTAAAAAGRLDADVLVVAFPQSQMQVHGYHRVVRVDAPRDVFARMSPWFPASVANVAPDPVPHTVVAWMDGLWYQLQRSGDRTDDPVDSLDVALLHREIIGPVLGVTDETMIDYVVGSDPVELVAHSVGETGIGFLLEPPTVEQIMTVADAGRFLPPKSTWFAPKVRSGFFIVER